MNSLYEYLSSIDYLPTPDPKAKDTVEIKDTDIKLEALRGEITVRNTDLSFEIPTKFLLTQIDIHEIVDYLRDKGFEVEYAESEY